MVNYMNKFTFESTLKIDIEDVICEIDLSDEIVNKAIVDYVAKSLVLNKKVKETDADKWWDEFKDASFAFLNTVLSKENVDKIFQDKVVDNCDISGLCVFILNEVTEFKKNKYLRYA